MANTIKLKRGTGSDPSASDLVLGEIAIRTDTGKLFTKKDNGTVAEISGSGGGGSDIFINTLSSSSGSGGGSASFNGSATRFTLSNPPDVSAQQLLVSINGVIQKPNSGTSPSEGFALDGTDIIFAAAPATGSDFFIITYGSIGLSVPADNSVTSAKIVNGTIVGTDLATNIDLVDNQKIRFGTGNDLQIFHNGTNSFIQNNTNNLYLRGTSAIILENTNNEDYIAAYPNSSVQLFYDNNKKFETSSSGVIISGILQVSNGSAAAPAIHFGDSDSGIYGDSSNGVRLTAGGSDTIIATTNGVTFPSSVKALTSLTLGSQSALSKPLYFADSASVQSASILLDNSSQELRIKNGRFAGKISFTTYNVERAIFDGADFNIPNDTGKIQFGASQDLQIYHDGSKSVIADVGTGGLFVAGSSISLTDAGITETMLYAVPNGGVALYYDNSQKLVTTSGGVIVTGDIAPTNHVLLGDNKKSIFGAGLDLQIYHTGSSSNSNIRHINTAGNLYIDSANSTYFRHYIDTGGTISFENFAVFNDDGAVELYFDGVKKFETAAHGLFYDGTGGDTYWYDGSSSANNVLKWLYTDNVKNSFGTSSDLEIFHDGTNSIIANNTGVFYLKTINGEFTLVGRPNAQTELYYDHSKKLETKANGVQVQDTTATGAYLTMATSSGTAGKLYATGNNTLGFLDSQNHYMLKGVKDAQVELYYDAAKKLQTTSTGATLTGTLVADGLIVGDGEYIRLGNSEDLLIVHDGSNSRIIEQGAGHFYIDTTQFNIRNNGGSEQLLKATANGSVQLYYDNDRVFYTETRGVRLADQTKIFENSSHNTAVMQHADIHHAIIFRGSTNNNGSTITNENVTTFREYGEMVFRTGGNGNMPIRLRIESNGVVSGNLNDTSDAKFKENIVSIADGAISKIKQLRPVNFDWKKEVDIDGNLIENKDTKGESGFIAQEVLTVIPDLVKGSEYNDDEKSSGYAVNTTGLVAYLTKALQEVIARLETLEGG